MAIKQIKVQTAQFDVINPQTRELLMTVSKLPDAETIGVFGDLLQGNENATAAGIVLFAYDCASLDAAYKLYSANNTLLTLERLADKNPSHMQLYVILRDQQLLEYKAGNGWGVGKVSKLIRERITIKSVPVKDFAGAEMASATDIAPDAPDWVHVLTNKLRKIPEVANLRIFGSAVTMHKDPADLDVAVVCATDDWNEAQDLMADLLYDLINLHDNGWLGEKLDLYVCLIDSAYQYSDQVGDWTPVFDGKQLAEDVRLKGKPIPQAVEGAITNKTPKRRRLKTDPEHRADRLEYKKDMKNPSKRRVQRLKRKIYVKKNKPKLQRKADTYRTWRARQSY